MHHPARRDLLFQAEESGQSTDNLIEQRPSRPGVAASRPFSSSLSAAVAWSPHRYDGVAPLGPGAGDVESIVLFTLVSPSHRCASRGWKKGALW